MKQPRHEDGTCGYEVLRLHPKKGIYLPVVLKDSRGHCPGDPLCMYTELGRMEGRRAQLPKMKRLKDELRRRVPVDLVEAWFDDEYLYELVCVTRNIEALAPVEGHDWPYRGART